MEVKNKTNYLLALTADEPIELWRAVFKEKSELEAFARRNPASAPSVQSRIEGYESLLDKIDVLIHAVEAQR